MNPLSKQLLKSMCTTGNWKIKTQNGRKSVDKQNSKYKSARAILVAARMNGLRVSVIEEH